MNPLTAREEELLTCIIAHIGEFGFPPTREEMMAMTGVAGVATFVARLKNLERKGWLRVEGHRAIRVVGARWRFEAAT